MSFSSETSICFESRGFSLSEWKPCDILNSFESQSSRTMRLWSNEEDSVCNSRKWRGASLLSTERTVEPFQLGLSTHDPLSHKVGRKRIEPHSESAGRLPSSIVPCVHPVPSLYLRAPFSVTAGSQRRTPIDN